MHRAFRLLHIVLLCLAPGQARASDPASRPALAAEIHLVIADAIAAPPSGSASLSILGANLADYAGNVGRDSARYEMFAAAARRILAGGSATLQSPDLTSLQLERAADALQRSASSVSAKSERIDLELTALLGRFHARRIIAAVHYNLFKRGLRLAELLAAAACEKEAVATWRELVAAATSARHPRAVDLRAQLKELEINLKELEEQCCPSDEAIVKEPVWQPATNR